MTRRPVDATGSDDGNGRSGGGADPPVETTGPGRCHRAIKALGALLGVAFLISGGSKLLGTAGQVRNFERWGYPQWFRLFTGGVEAGGGAGLLAGVVSPSLGVLGGGLVAGTMLGALYTHLVRVGDSLDEAAPAGVLLALAAVVTGGRVAGRRSVERRPSGGRASGSTPDDGGREP